MELEEADGLEIIVLVDNYCDELLEDTPVAKRFSAPSPLGMMGEPGLSLLVTVFKNNDTHTLLLDGGMSGSCLMHNLNLLSCAKASAGITGRAKKVEAIVLSHGHSDHFKGLESFLVKHSQKLPFILHPFASTRRRYQPDTGMKDAAPVPVHEMVRPDKDAFEQAGALVKEQSDPSLLASNLVLVTGQIPRKTDFEKGTPGLEARVDGQWQPDPFIDDQAIAVHVKDKGLVVLSGCSHAGIINTVSYARELTGVDALHCVMGGFHLPGPAISPLTQRTITEMKRLAPDYIVPMHCTGWEAINGFSREMPEQFILNSVGTAYHFGQAATGRGTENPTQPFTLNRKAMESC